MTTIHHPNGETHHPNGQTHHANHSSSSSIQPPTNDLPPTSPPPPRTASTLNLSVLRRHLPTLTAIITIAAYTVIYIFRPALSAWEKSGIEGTLFVVRLDLERYAIIVLNRRGLDTFVLELKKSEEVEVTEEFVIVQGEGGVWGLWIFEEEGSTRGGRERVGGVILECAGRAERRVGLDEERDRNWQMDG